jgi:hypothetical protein
MINEQESNSEEVPKVSLSCQASVGSPFVHLLFTSFSDSSSMLATTNHHCAILKEPAKPVSGDHKTAGTTSFTAFALFA